MKWQFRTILKIIFIIYCGSVYAASDATSNTSNQNVSVIASSNVSVVPNAKDTDLVDKFFKHATFEDFNEQPKVQLFAPSYLNSNVEQ
jgi:hypothetical protein